MSNDLESVAESLTALMKRAAPDMTVKTGGSYGIQLLADWDNPLKPGERMWFGGVRTMKSYVSVHLMPVYSHASLAARIPPPLRKRMQGKSCFNFKTEDPALFAQLEALIQEAARVYAKPFRLERQGRETRVVPG
jgi:hypothetical protein